MSVNDAGGALIALHIIYAYFFSPRRVHPVITYLLLRPLQLTPLLLLLSGLLLLQPVYAQSVGGSGLAAAVAPELQAADLLSGDTFPAGPRVARNPTINEGRAASASTSMMPAEGLPFGANLFRGGFSNDSEDGLNPDYTVQPGDRVSVRIWGATAFNQSLIVDHQGNIFVPTVGPITLSGTRNQDLNDRVAKAVSRVFTDNVRVYTSLDGSQPVAVFVTGYVPNPGRFAGIPSNSLLYFLDRAGGVDANRGSYRNISVLRDAKTIASVDLYDFLLEGSLKSIQFRDGDTIVVGERGSYVSVSGDVSNASEFELTGSTVSGREIRSMALLKADVNYVAISGIRSGAPFSIYVKLDKFATMSLQNGDQIHFRADQHDQVIVVEVEGANLGPSRFAVPRNTRLQELLDHIEVDVELADVQAVSLKREAIAVRQKAALQESLQRLEAKYLTASSATDRESAIRAQEAQLIGQFVKNARLVEPNGRLVVARNGDIANVLLQSGDTITIPARSDSVLLSGEVLVSQAMLYQPGDSARDYIQRSGGFNQQALTDKIVVVHANGEVSASKDPVVKAGDEIIVLPRVPTKNLQLAATIVDIVYKIAVAASVAVNL